MRLLAIDTETGGRDPKTCGLCEVGALAFDMVEGGPVEVATYSRLVRFNPNLRYEPEAMAINGITFDELYHAPPEESMVSSLRAWLWRQFHDPANPGAPLRTIGVIGSFVRFDLEFLDEAACRVNRGEFSRLVKVRELKELYRNRHPEGRAGLTDMAKAFGIPIPEDRHRALGDCRLGVAVYKALMDESILAAPEFHDLDEPIDPPPPPPEPGGYPAIRSVKRAPHHLRKR